MSIGITRKIGTAHQSVASPLRKDATHMPTHTHTSRRGHRIVARSNLDFQGHRFSMTIPSAPPRFTSVEGVWGLCFGESALRGADQWVAHGRPQSPDRGSLEHQLEKGRSELGLGPGSHVLAPTAAPDVKSRHARADVAALGQIGLRPSNSAPGAGIGANSVASPSLERRLFRPTFRGPCSGLGRGGGCVWGNLQDLDPGGGGGRQWHPPEVVSSVTSPEVGRSVHGLGLCQVSPKTPRRKHEAPPESER